jgi:hypothetical protein
MDAKRVLWVNAGCASGAGRLPAAWQTTCLDPAKALNGLKNNEFHAVVLARISHTDRVERPVAAP